MLEEEEEEEILLDSKGGGFRGRIERTMKRYEVAEKFFPVNGHKFVPKVNKIHFVTLTNFLIGF